MNLSFIATDGILQDVRWFILSAIRNSNLALKGLTIEVVGEDVVDVKFMFTEGEKRDELMSKEG